MIAQTLFDDGKLREALEAQARVVAENPRDAAARLFLIELHLYVHQLREAREHLNLLPIDGEEMHQFLEAYHQLLDAEEKRLAIFERGLPLFLGEPSEHLLQRLDALETYRRAEGNQSDYVDLLDEATSETPEIRGHVDGREFDEMRNLDDLLGAVLEGLVGSEYVWVPFESIRKLRLAEIDSPRDWLFRPAQLTLHDRRVFEIYIPTRYVQTQRSDDEELLLGRATDCIESTEQLSIGVGAQLIWFDDSELTFHDFRLLEIRSR